MNEFNIRPMAASDTMAVASVHVRSFPGFFLTFLGKRFLNELYSAIVQDPLGITYVAEKDGEIVGFIAGVTYINGLYRNLLKQRLVRFAWASLGGFLRKPTILPRLLRALRMTSSAHTAPNCGTLMSFAVLPGIQGKGIGYCLMNEFLAASRRHGLELIELATDRDNNERVNRFYQRMGFSLSRVYITPEGRRMNVYTIPLVKAETSSRVPAAHTGSARPTRSGESAPI